MLSVSFDVFFLVVVVVILSREYCAFAGLVCLFVFFLTNK